MPVLVSYATKHGSTQEVAEAIAETLDAHWPRTSTCSPPAG